MAEAKVEDDENGESDQRTAYGSQSSSHFTKRSRLLSTVVKRFRQNHDIESQPRVNRFSMWHPRFANYLEMRSKVYIEHV